MVIDDTNCEEVEFEADENKAQKMYGEFVSSSTASFEADRATIAEKEKHVEDLIGVEQHRGITARER